PPFGWFVIVSWRVTLPMCAVTTFGPSARPVSSPMTLPFARRANIPVTSCPPTSTLTSDTSAPVGSTTSTSASPALTRSARFDSTRISLSEQLGPPPGSGSASQVLAQTFTVPPAASHRAASRTVLHLVPELPVTQQVTASGLPQVEWDSQRLTADRQVLLTSAALACSAAHRTKSPRRGAPAQSHADATTARALAMSLRS